MQISGSQRLVRFKERVNGGERARGKSTAEVLVNPDFVAAILPKQTYTTLSVGGHWIHVTASYDEVIRKLSMRENTSV